MEFHTEFLLKCLLGCAVWFLLRVSFCTGYTPTCLIWTSQGSIVHRDTGLVVYCSFNCKQECRRVMNSKQPPVEQRHTVVNSTATTTFFHVENITEDQTFSCMCECGGRAEGLCGLDIKAGYPPETPQNILCEYIAMTNQTGEVRCSWTRGRKTHLKDTKERVTLVQDWSSKFPKSISATNPPWATFQVSNRVQVISVQVLTHNALGSAESPPTNYTLADITIPTTPLLEGAQCSSRNCNISIWQPIRTKHLLVQFSPESGLWSEYSHLVEPLAWDELVTNPRLEPYQLYHFRARSKFATGLWSNWSNVVSKWTEEEAPAKEPDVWYTQPSPRLNSIRLHWKPMSIADARGQILLYSLTVHFSKSGRIFSTKNISKKATSASIQLCSGCYVAVRAFNSKGWSPPAKIRVYKVKASILLDTVVKVSNNTVNVTWKWETLPPVGQVVEWYCEGFRVEELDWLRLTGEDRQAVITDLNASECYDGAVKVLHGDGTMTVQSFRFGTSQSVPQASPSLQPEVDANKVTVTWAELPRPDRGGCITNYTIYLEYSDGHAQRYSVPPTERLFVLEDTPPGIHSLWMTAWNSKGEGPPAPKVKIYIQGGTAFFLLVGYSLLAVAVFLLLCIFRITAVRKRVMGLFQRFIPPVVPDPANSKWAKENSQEKATMKRQLLLQSDSLRTEEEELIISIVTGAAGEAGSPARSPSKLRKTLTIYIKCDSRDSDSSEQTQISMESNLTSDQDDVSDRCLDEEEEEEFGETLNWTGCNKAVRPQLLTLDSVRIDCSKLLENF
ncbi:interleukin-12 receptor subunit beta-2 [Stigmatopora nigra]